jgi:hypothetical protein
MLINSIESIFYKLKHWIVSDIIIILKVWS